MDIITGDVSLARIDPLLYLVNLIAVARVKSDDTRCCPGVKVGRSPCL